MDHKEQQQQIQINLDPNLYMISNVTMNMDEENFYTTVFSGSQARQFVATPKHAKRIYLLLQQQIQNYEKQFGELKTELPKMTKNTQEDNRKIGF